MQRCCLRPGFRHRPSRDLRCSALIEFNDPLKMPLMRALNSHYWVERLTEPLQLIKT